MPQNLIAGHATPESTAAYAAAFTNHRANGFYRTGAGSLTFPSLGIGTYLGDQTKATSASYSQAVTAAIQRGIHLIDTSLNYRHQLSERAIGAAIGELCAADPSLRGSLILCTKAGYLVPDALPVAALRPSDIIGNMHSMAPAFLADQLERSRANLGLATIDVFYLHNPETQLRHLDRNTFHEHLRAAFETLEGFVAEGRIRWYGAATWDGFRVGGEPKGLSLTRMAEIATAIAGQDHHFRFIQLPFNLAMTEAVTKQAEPGPDGSRTSVLQAAQRLGITAIASASLLQARLTRDLPDQLAGAMPGPDTDAARAIQFARSAPGLTTALVGMSKSSHVLENLRAATYPPLPPDSFMRLLGS